MDPEMPQSLPTAAFAINRQRSLTRADSKHRMMQLMPLVVVFYSFFILPPEVEATVFGINFPAYRIALLVFSVSALWTSLQGRIGSLQFMDVAIAIIGFWIMLSFILNYGFEVGIVRGAGILIDTLLPYFVARTCIKSLDDLRYFLILVFPAVAFAGLTLVVESVSGRLLIRPAFAAVFGAMDVFTGGETSGSLGLEGTYRLGLLRAYGPFPHPILAGAMMIGFLPLYYFSSLRSWPFIGGVLVALTGFFSLSSAAFLALIVAIGGVLIHQIKPYFPKISWWTITGLLMLLFWTMHMASKNGIIYVIARLTLTPDTAGYRIHIWEWGSLSVEKHPWFGIGYRQWERANWMGESVDAHFLLLAIRHGLVVPIMMLAAILYGMIRLGMIVPNLRPKDREFAVGINICVFMFVLVGQTVTYFGSSNILFVFVIAFLASAVSWSNVQMQVYKRQQIIQQSRMMACAAA
jgi:O-antigen ligase